TLTLPELKSHLCAMAINYKIMTFLKLMKMRLLANHYWFLTKPTGPSDKLNDNLSANIKKTLGGEEGPILIAFVPGDKIIKIVSTFNSDASRLAIRHPI
ncbi:1719_t:CDS:2, partial [Funneliformis mosseae]